MNITLADGTQVVSKHALLLILVIPGMPHMPISARLVDNLSHDLVLGMDCVRFGAIWPLMGLAPGLSAQYTCAQHTCTRHDTCRAWPEFVVHMPLGLIAPEGFLICFWFLV